MEYLSLKLVLDTNKFHEGLNEINNHFENQRPDDYLNGLVKEVRTANQSLFDAMRVEPKRQTIINESRKLNERIAAATHYIDSYCFHPDPEVKASAITLRQHLKSYAKPFAKMKVDARLSALRTLKRELATPELKVHVDRLPELASRIEDISRALDVLAEKRLQVDQANSHFANPQRLRPLKYEAASRLRLLTEYLKTMAAKDPESYAYDYGVVTEIITRLNAGLPPRKTKAELADTQGNNAAATALSGH